MTDKTMSHRGRAVLRIGLIAGTIASAAVSGALAARAADRVVVEAKKSGADVAVSASARVHAPYAVIWHTLTDYDHLAEFIPGMSLSHVLRRNGPLVIVEQSGNAGNMLLHYPIDVVVASEERPPTTITVKILRGNLRTYEGAYHLERAADDEDAFILSWTGTIRPDFELPAFVEEWALRQNILEQFESMITEIERRGKNGHLG